MGWRETRDSHRFHTIASLARSQEGLVSVAQLHAAGWTEDAIAHRRATGQLHRWTRGVYSVGHRRLGPRGYLWIAHLATGAAVSHVSAAWAHGLLPPPAMPVHVTTTGEARSRRGITVHRTSRRLPTTELDGLPVTTVARTLDDLPAHLLLRAMREARFKEVLVPGELATRRSRAAYERISAVPPHRTRSGLEHWFLEVCDAHGLPHPHVNEDVHGRERDFRWPGHTLVVEVDGAQHRWQDDRRRDRELFARHGLTTLRFTGNESAPDVARTVSAALARLRTLE